MTLEDRIKNIALDIANDYPNIETCGPWEQLYAIECAYKGTISANEDLHKIIHILREKLGMSAEEVIDMILPIL